MANNDKPDLRVVSSGGQTKTDPPKRAALSPELYSDANAEPNEQPGAEALNAVVGEAAVHETVASTPSPPAFNLSDIEKLVKSAAARETVSPERQPGVSRPGQPNIPTAAPERPAAQKVTKPGFDDPLPPKQPKAKQFRLGPDPDDKAVFNYIFTVGRPGSGKTTFQSHILRFLNTGGEHDVEADPTLSMSNVEFRDLYLEWQDQWDRGLFPRRSEIGRPLDFRYIVTPNMDGFPPLRFGFLEISGEDFIQLAQKAVAGRPPELLRSIDEFLNNPRVNIAFLFVCQGQDLNGDDLLFSQFLEYVKNKIGRDFQSHCSAVLIIADPETCQRRLAHRLKSPELEDEPLDIDTFIRHFLPSSAAKLARWRNRATIATFHVGRIVEGKNAEGKPIPLIAEPSFEDAKLIYDWLYHRFTGKRIGVEDGFLPKVREWLRKLAELGGGGR